MSDHPPPAPPTWAALAARFDANPTWSARGTVEVQIDDEPTRYTFSVRLPSWWRVEDARGRVVVAAGPDRTVVREDVSTLQVVPAGVAVRWPDDVPPQLLDGPAQFLASFADLPDSPVVEPGLPHDLGGRAGWAFEVVTERDREPIRVVIDDETGAVVSMIAPTGERAELLDLTTGAPDVLSQSVFEVTEPVRRDWVDTAQSEAGVQVTVPAYWPAGVGHDVLEARRDGSVVVRLHVPGSPLLVRAAPGVDTAEVGRGRHVHRWNDEDGWGYALVVEEPLDPIELGRVRASIRFV